MCIHVASHNLHALDGGCTNLKFKQIRWANDFGSGAIHNVDQHHDALTFKQRCGCWFWQTVSIWGVHLFLILLYNNEYDWSYMALRFHWFVSSDQFCFHVAADALCYSKSNLHDVRLGQGYTVRTDLLKDVHVHLVCIHMQVWYVLPWCRDTWCSLCKTAYTVLVQGNTWRVTLIVAG